MEIKIKVVRLAHGGNLPLPSYQTPHAAGMDLYAARASMLNPGERALVPTGLTVEIPEGFEAQIRPRSGLALRHGITLLNSPGTIDADYRGEIGVILINHGSEPFEVALGERIAQLVVAPVSKCVWEEVAELAATSRGKEGFGSTGK